MKLIDIFFPPRCPYCGKIMEYGNIMCCEKCRVKLYVKPHIIELSDSRCVAAFKYDGIYRKAILNFKFYNKPYYSRQLAVPLKKVIDAAFYNIDFDLITYVPLSRESLKERGYNQAELLAKELARTMDTECLPLLIKHKTNTPQHTLPREKRLENVKGVYKPNDTGFSKFKNILLVDDIITTGATLNECVRMIKEKHSNSSIYCAAVAYAAGEGTER